MVDSDVVGCCWIELPKGKYKMREEKDSSDHDSRYPGKVSVCKAAPLLFSLPRTKQRSEPFRYCVCPAGFLVSVRGGRGLDRLNKSSCRGRVAEDRTAPGAEL